MLLRYSCRAQREEPTDYGMLPRGRQNSKAGLVKNQGGVIKLVLRHCLLTRSTILCGDYVVGRAPLQPRLSSQAIALAGTTWQGPPTTAKSAPIPSPIQTIAARDLRKMAEMGAKIQVQECLAQRHF